MKLTADFRKISREALQGKGLIAIIVGQVASLLGGLATEGSDLKVSIPICKKA